MSEWRKIGLGFVHNPTVLGKAIALVTVPLCKILRKESHADTATHVYIWFEDNHGKRVYFEALLDEDFTGPRPIEKVRGWAEDTKGRWNEEHDLSAFFTPDQIGRRYELCDTVFVKIWQYNKRQFIQQLRIARLARRFLKGSPLDVICSEAASRIVNNEALDFREYTGRSHNNQSPNGLRLACKFIESRLFGIGEDK